MRRYGLFFLAVFLFFSFSGCNTLKGAGNGFKEDFSNSIDVFKKTPQAIQKTDDWIKENMW